MSILVSVDEADFVYLRKQTESTSGNLSVQLDKLSEADSLAKSMTWPLDLAHYYIQVWRHASHVQKRYFCT